MLDDTVKRFLQTSHSYGFSPDWLLGGTLVLSSSPNTGIDALDESDILHHIMDQVNDETSLETS